MIYLDVPDDSINLGALLFSLIIILMGVTGIIIFSFLKLINIYRQGYFSIIQTAFFYVSIGISFVWLVSFIMNWFA